MQVLMRKKEGRKLLEVMAKFMALFVLSEEYAYRWTYQVVYIKYIQLLYVKYNSIKCIFKNDCKEEKLYFLSVI